jgi:hypothetical protein
MNTQLCLVEETRTGKSFSAPLGDIIKAHKNGQLDGHRTVRMTIDGDYEWSTVAELCKQSETTLVASRTDHPTDHSMSGDEGIKIRKPRRWLRIIGQLMFLMGVLSLAMRVDAMILHIGYNGLSGTKITFYIMTGLLVARWNRVTRREETQKSS